MQNSDYIVFVDESGDHSLDSLNPRYPIFVLSFCVFRKETYIREISPALGMLKVSLFGHDTIVLHEYEIRKKEGVFNKLSREKREELFEALNELMTNADFTLIPIVINKTALKKSGIDSPNVYHLAMQYGLELLYQYLSDRDQQDMKTHVIFEARGKSEDLALEVEFRRVCDYQNSNQKPLPFEIVIANKKTNSCGLQFADLAARPIGLSVLRPEQSNRAFGILESKLYEKLNFLKGPFTFAIKAKGPQVVLEA
ncbi:MAG: DUF3800 domain-containing protein [Verrucomicrobia bacterium]|nr:DUF3800 domain-containing protein [Verrucomicrobiota bacterium]